MQLFVHCWCQRDVHHNRCFVHRWCWRDVHHDSAGTTYTASADAMYSTTGAGEDNEHDRERSEATSCCNKRCGRGRRRWRQTTSNLREQARRIQRRAHMQHEKLFSGQRKHPGAAHCPQCVGCTTTDDVSALLSTPCNKNEGYRPRERQVLSI